MTQLITLSRAARLVGVTRTTLQQQIRDGELTTFEGQLDLSELLRVYPQTKVEDSAMIERADRLIKVMLKGYTRLALINTGHYELERYRDYARGVAARFGLRYEEIQGAISLVKKMLYGPWDDEFVVVPPGGEITFETFFPPSATGPACPNGS